MSILDDMLKEAGITGREPTDEEVRMARYFISTFVNKAILELAADENWGEVPEATKDTLKSFVQTINQLSKDAPDETMRSLVRSCLKLIAFEDAKNNGKPMDAVIEVAGGFGAGFGKD